MNVKILKNTVGDKKRLQKGETYDLTDKTAKVLLVMKKAERTVDADSGESKSDAPITDQIKRMTTAQLETFARDHCGGMVFPDDPKMTNETRRILILEWFKENGDGE
jgi:hypothetical protein